MKKTSFFPLFSSFFIATLFSCISLTLKAQIAQSADAISPLLIGEKIPDAHLLSSEGEVTDLQALFKKKKTILLVYRGGWCPFCNAHFSELAAISGAITEKGYQIVAISPDDPAHLQNTEEKNALENYLLLSDSDGKLIQQLGLAFEAPQKYSMMLEEHSGGKNKGFLPVPAVFILDTEGTILMEYISPNFKQRLNATLLMAILENL
ncbi:peroxiredoxin-like family protein [Hugenholtzia roseola]|uniref:peroxiredoxin-like family protein n=1 Tax=Hugenholtzia roseola TaxID=1002 RepID=UPI0003F5A26D|nr:peroxiredoxin-like family protein [Hugenholtzia roseola]